MKPSCEDKSSNHTIAKVFGVAALVAVATGIIISIPDIKRYFRIRMM